MNVKEELQDFRQNNCKQNPKARADELKFIIRHRDYYLGRWDDLQRELQIIEPIAQTDPDAALQKALMEQEANHCLFCIQQISRTDDACKRIMLKTERDMLTDFHVRKIRRDDLGIKYYADGSTIGKWTGKSLQKIVQFFDTVN